MLGLLVGKPVGVLPPWGVIAVAASWPMGTQPPLATRALIKLFDMFILFTHFFNSSKLKNHCKNENLFCDENF